MCLEVGCMIAVTPSLHFFCFQPSSEPNTKPGTGQWKECQQKRGDNIFLSKFPLPLRETFYFAHISQPTGSMGRDLGQISGMFQVCPCRVRSHTSLWFIFQSFFWTFITELLSKTRVLCLILNTAWIVFTGEWVTPHTWNSGCFHLKIISCAFCSGNEMLPFACNSGVSFHLQLTQLR